MAKKRILLVDADPRSLRLLEVSLRQAGYNVSVAKDGEEALSHLGHGLPDLVITDTRLPKVDGYTVVRTIRAQPDGGELPVIFLLSHKSVEERIRGLELGVDDYLTRPVFVGELTGRVALALSRHGLSRGRSGGADVALAGNLRDTRLVDLVQTMEISRRSGVLDLRWGSRTARAYFEAGQLIDAEAGRLRGEEAFHRMLTWGSADFTLTGDTEDRERTITLPTHAVVLEGMRRLGDWGRIEEQLPSLEDRYVVDVAVIESRLPDMPSEIERVLSLIDGRRTLLDVIDESPFDDLSTLTTISKLCFEGVVYPVSAVPPPVAPKPASSPEPSPALYERGETLEQTAPAPPVVATLAQATLDPSPLPPPRDAMVSVADAGPIDTPTPAASGSDLSVGDSIVFEKSSRALEFASGALPKARALSSVPPAPAAPVAKIEASSVPPVAPKASSKPPVSAKVSSVPPPRQSEPSVPDDGPVIAKDLQDKDDDDSDADRPAGTPGAIPGPRVVYAFGAIILVSFLALVYSRSCYRGQYDTKDGLTLIGAASGAPSTMPVLGLATAASARVTAATSALPAPIPSGSAALSAFELPDPVPAAIPDGGLVRVVPRSPESTRALADGGTLTAQAQRMLERQSPGRAIDLAWQATRADPSDAEAWLTLGAAYQAAGYPAKAKEAYQSCTSRAGSSPRLSECKALLGE